MSALSLDIQNNSKFIPPKDLDIFTRQISQVLVAGMTDKIFNIGKSIHQENMSVSFHHGNIKNSCEHISSSTIAVLLVMGDQYESATQAISKIRANHKNLPILVLATNNLLNRQAKDLFCLGVSDIIYSIHEIPRFQKYLLELCKFESKPIRLAPSRKGDGRLSKALMARINSISNFGSKITVYVRDKTAYIAGKIKSVKRKKFLEQIALSTPGISNVIMSNYHLGATRYKRLKDLGS